MGAVYDDLPGHEGYAVDEAGAYLAACSAAAGVTRIHTPPPRTAPTPQSIDGTTITVSHFWNEPSPSRSPSWWTRPRRAVVHLARARPAAATAALDGIVRWAQQPRWLAHDFDLTVPFLRQRIDDVGRPSELEPPGRCR